MPALFLLPLFVLVGAFANRHRGGWLGTGADNNPIFGARPHFCYAVAALFAIGTGIHWALLVVVFGTFIGALAGQGTDMADDTPGKALGLFGSGAYNMVGVFAGALWLAMGEPTTAWHMPTVPQLMLLMFALVPACGKPLAYWLGKVLPSKELVLFGNVFWGGFTEWGEVLFGAVEGLTIWVVCYQLHLYLFAGIA